MPDPGLMIFSFFKKLFDASLQCEFRTFLENRYELCPYFPHPFDTYISSKNWFVSYTVLVYIEGISAGRDFIRKWEQQGSLSFTMVQRYLRVTISYCWSLLARGCQESNDSSTPYSPFPSLGHVASKYYQKAGIWIDINPNGHLDFMSSRTDD